MKPPTKQILTIQPCTITSEDIYRLYGINKHREYVFKMIPKWVVNKEHGNVILSEYFLQWIGREPGEQSSSYYVFDIHSADPYLEAEINECGVEWIFKECGTNWGEVLPKEVPGYNEFVDSYVNQCVRLVFDLIYTTTYYEGIPEGDLEVGFDRILEL